MPLFAPRSGPRNQDEALLRPGAENRILNFIAPHALVTVPQPGVHLASGIGSWRDFIVHARLPTCTSLNAGNRPSCFLQLNFFNLQPNTACRTVDGPCRLDGA